MNALAVDLGGSHASCAAVDDERVLVRERVPLQAARGLGEALPAIAAALRRVRDAAGRVPGGWAGVAFGFCGLVDSDQGRVLSTNAKYDDAPSVDLVAWGRQAFSLPIRVENDARLALLGERQAGAATGFGDVVMVTLGTGIGGVAMIRGRLLRGRHFQAGVLGGHLLADAFGRPCTCGAVGCIEAEASTWALPQLAREWPGFAGSRLAALPRLDFEALFACAEKGDGVAIAIRDRCLRIWAAGAVAMIHAWDPELLVVGGGVMAAAGLVLPAIESYLDAHAWTPWGRVAVRKAALGTDAALLGAVPLLSGA